MMRLAQAYERDDNPVEKAWKRVMTPAAKFWVCKRAVELTGEAMEIFGGNGYVDEGVMGRLFREAPVNSIWEGSGNVMCLDVLRSLARGPQCADALMTEWQAVRGMNAAFDAALGEFATVLTRPRQDSDELGARWLAERIGVLTQAALLLRHAPTVVADSFCVNRLTGGWRGTLGSMAMSQARALMDRALVEA